MSLGVVRVLVSIHGCILADMSMVEQLLQIISSQLSVYEVMSVFRGM